jgi:hypothetical protein
MGGEQWELDRCCPCMDLFIYLNKLPRGQGEKIKRAAKKVGRLCVHMYVHILCIISSFLNQNCMEPRAFFVRIL